MSDDTCLRLLAIEPAGRQLHLRYGLGKLRFSNTIWYGDVDLDRLGEVIGADQLRRLLFHIAAFELNKLASLAPERVDWGDYVDLATPAFRELWQTVFGNVWAQWRFENGRPDYLYPEMSATGADEGPPALDGRNTDAGYLAFCGGGKDSLLTLMLCQQLGLAHGTLAYAASYYGPAAQQHALIDKLIDHAPEAPERQRRHKLWMYDDFLDSPVLELANEGGIRTLTAAETPSSIFAALPLVLAQGYRYAVLGHERSADAPQAHWPESGEPINHQWGKSYEAERLLNGYIQQHLIRDFDYFSILKPIYDVGIFGAIAAAPASVPHTHSCNIRKPWCGHCAKCLYVWLGYTAFLPEAVVRETFGPVNWYDDPANVPLFRELLGLEARLPFECIGEADEAALYMRLAVARGYDGAAMAACAERLRAPLDPAVAQRYLSLDVDGANIPAAIREPLAGLLKRNAKTAERLIAELLPGDMALPAE